MIIAEEADLDKGEGEGFRQGAVLGEVNFGCWFLSCATNFERMVNQAYPIWGI